jgi:uncharacterized membrane protein YesL
MILFLLKKTFFDAWDNLFRLILINLGFIASAAIPILLAPLLSAVPALSLAVLVLGVGWCFVYLSATAFVVKYLSDYSSFGFMDFVQALKEGWPAGLLLGALALLWALIAFTALPFYASMNSLPGLLGSAMIFWILVTVLLAFQYFLPIRTRLDRDLRKVVKKCFIIFFDNPGLVVFTGLHNLVMLALSFFLAFLIPGPAAILLFMDEALRLRLLKYDYLEAHPDANRRRIPWDEILIDEREKTGTRSLRNFIFPWKD